MMDVFRSLVNVSLIRTRYKKYTNMKSGQHSMKWNVLMSHNLKCPTPTSHVPHPLLLTIFPSKQSVCCKFRVAAVVGFPSVCECAWWMIGSRSHDSVKLGEQSSFGWMMVIMSLFSTLSLTQWSVEQGCKSHISAGCAGLANNCNSHKQS